MIYFKILQQDTKFRRNVFLMQKSLKSKGEPICRRYYRITRGLTEGGTISCSWAASALLWHRDSHDSVEI